MDDGAEKKRVLQRRRYFRHPACIELTWGRAKDELPLDRCARILDLSGNGLSMEGTGECPRVGEWIAVSFRIPPKNTPSVLVAEVKREIARHPDGWWSIAAEFCGITDDERDDIIAFLIREQTRTIRTKKARGIL